MLAYFGEVDARTVYKKEYETFITEFESRGDAESSLYLEFAYYNYAALLVLYEKDTKAARPLVEKLVARVRNEIEPDYNEFILLTRVKKGVTQRDFDTEAKMALSEAFPEFRTLIENPR